MKKSYFDYAAATPLSPSVFAAVKPFFMERFYNPSAQYLFSQDVKKAVEVARVDVALVLGARASEIIFTAGGTEANNLAIHGVMGRYPDANCIVSAIEHESVLESAKLYDHKISTVKIDGRIDIENLQKLIDNKTVLVSVMYVNNEIGTVQPIAEISKIIKNIRAERVKKGNKLPLYFHADACQAPNYLHILTSTLGVDMLTLNAGKIYGPKQCGALFVKTGVELKPFIYGGGQERGLRSGTENVANIVGFAAALKETSELREKEAKRLSELRDEVFSLIASDSKWQINGSIKKRLPNNIHLTFPGIDNEKLLMQLDEKGFMVAAGSACSASSDEPSHVLKAIGLDDKTARSSLRITMGRGTTRAELTGLLKTLKELTTQGAQ